MPHRATTPPHLAAALFAASLIASAGGQTPRSVLELEQTLVDTIASCERSVVAVVQTPPRAAAPVEPNALRSGRRIVPGRRFGQSPLPGLDPVPAPAALASGTGVVIDSDGLILTQYLNVALDQDHLVIDTERRRFRATPIAADPRSGLAVLRVETEEPEEDGEGFSTWAPAEHPALPIGRAEQLRKGRLVVALGNPFALQSDGQPTASWGTVTNTARKAPRMEKLNEAPSTDGDYRTTLHHLGSLIQTDAKLGWNASGGALVTLSGELVGVTTSAAMIAGHESPAGYAIPLNKAMRRVVKRLAEGEEPEYGLLGISFNQVTMASQRTGAIGIGVEGVFQGSPASRSGLRKADLVTHVNGVPTPDADALRLVVGGLPPESDTRVTYERAGLERQTTVRLGKAYVVGEKLFTKRPPSWRGLRVDYPTALPSQVLRNKVAEGRIDPEGCVVVSEVEPGSVSEENGIEPYRFISHVGETRVTTPKEFYEAIRDAENDRVSLRFTKANPTRARNLRRPTGRR